MSRLMSVLGIILLAAGVACAVMGLVNQAPLLARGIDMGAAINLIVGGILAIGLGGVIGALQGGVAPAAIEEYAAPEAPPEKAPEATAAAEVPASKPMRFPSFSRKVEEAGVPAATAAAATSVATEASEAVTPAVKETINALEQAKSDLEAAMGTTEDDIVPAAESGELYVVEEKVIRGRPARILSDGTVEAETEEGWMRFENLDHLDEYLDAIEQA